MAGYVINGEIQRIEKGSKSDTYELYIQYGPNTTILVVNKQFMLDTLSKVAGMLMKGGGIDISSRRLIGTKVSIALRK